MDTRNWPEVLNKEKKMTVTEYNFNEMTAQERNELVGKTLWRQYGRIGFQRFQVFEIGSKKFKGKAIIAGLGQGMIQKNLTPELILWSHHPKTLERA